jgi:preprotein translocase subunit SecG
MSASAIITLVLIVHTLITIGLVTVILLQRSEGGGLGIGSGSAGGLVTARGAADLLTRSTSILAAAFVATSLLLAILYGQEGRARRIDADAASRAAVPTVPTPGEAVPTPSQAPATPGLPGIPFGGDAAPAALGAAAPAGPANPAAQPGPIEGPPLQIEPAEAPPLAK